MNENEAPSEESSPAEVAILVIDDNSTIRETISIILNAEPDFRVCGTAGTMEEAVPACSELNPDIALIDLSLRGGDGIELIKILKEAVPHIKLVVFSLHDEALYIDAAKKAGALGYITKDESPTVIMECLRLIQNGESRFPKPYLQ